MQLDFSPGCSTRKRLTQLNEDEDELEDELEQ